MTEPNKEETLAMLRQWSVELQHAKGAPEEERPIMAKVDFLLDHLKEVDDELR